MSISLRGTKYHYRFQISGKSYSGTCLGCEISDVMTAQEKSAIKRKAAKYELDAKEKAQQELREIAQAESDIRRNKTVRALVENYRYELTGGRPIRLSEAYELAAAKPAKRKASARYQTMRQSAWRDFCAFMAGEFPDIEMLADVRRAHCETFVQFLTENGRYDKSVTFTREARGPRKRSKTVSYERTYMISAKTIGDIAGVCRWVFSRLDEDAGLITNPWHNVVLPAEDPIPREIFTGEELMLIWDGIQSNPFCYHLFVVAANSGFPEEDICLLKWSDIDWVAQGIRRLRCKTGADMTLPLMPELAAYLASLPRTGEYVSEEHSRLYQQSQSLVSERVATFLRGLGIQTTVQVPGRKAQSVKDLHSMRHVFCYRAKRAGIPLDVIQKFVGHRIVAMTQHYADHDTMADLHLEIKKLPALFAGENGAPTIIELGGARRQLADLAYSLPDSEVQRLLSLVNIA
jgi:integrase